MRARIPAPQSHAAGWARLTGALAVPVLVLGALGTRIGVLPGPVLVPVLLVGFALGLVAVGLAIYALADIWKSGAHGAGAAFAGILYALPVLVLLGGVSAAALYYPRLTEISTDLADPPALAENPAQAVEPGSADGAEAQSRSYPDIGPRIYPQPVAAVYTAARALVADRGWEVTEDVPPPSAPKPDAKPSAADGPEPAEDQAVIRALSAKRVATQSRSEALQGAPAPAAAAAPDLPTPAAEETGTIRAVARTLLFGFPDSVVLRLRAEGQGTRLDMRSASGTGLHDLGQNARRVRSFLADLDLALQPAPEAPAAPPPATPRSTAPDQVAQPATQ